MMKFLKKVLLWIGSVIIVGYVLIVSLFYFYQYKIIFLPKALSSDFEFKYQLPFEEMFFQVDENTKLNGLLFKSDSTKGLVFYLHGNAGALDTWGRVANIFVDNQYDCFILDYRGYGKSESAVTNEAELFSDINSVYQKMLARYAEENVIIVGYSIGTGPAAQLAATHQPKRLILQAPYNNLTSILNFHYPFIPSFLLNIMLTTDQYLEKVQSPITIFHGDEDKIIPFECSLKLSTLFDEHDELIRLDGHGHHDLHKNPVYIKNMSRILSD